MSALIPADKCIDLRLGNRPVKIIIKDDYSHPTFISIVETNQPEINITISSLHIRIDESIQRLMTRFNEDQVIEIFHAINQLLMSYLKAKLYFLDLEKRAAPVVKKVNHLLKPVLKQLEDAA